MLLEDEDDADDDDEPDEVTGAEAEAVNWAAEAPQLLVEVQRYGAAVVGQVTVGVKFH